MIDPETAPLGVEEEDDDYEPDFPAAEDTEQILNNLDTAPPEEVKPVPASVALTHFTLPPPPPLNTEDAARIGRQTVEKVLDVLPTLGEKGKKSKAGINRLAASAYDRDAWITIVTRLASRASAGLETNEGVKTETENGDVASISIGNTIRESLYLYVLEDFRKRIDIALAWLCEEWYNDKIQFAAEEDAVLHYEKWVLKVMDGMVPFLDGQDRSIVIKFLGEIPGLSMDVLDRVKDLCRNPATATMALQSLLFLVAYRPPVRELVLDAVEDIWTICESCINLLWGSTNIL